MLYHETFLRYRDDLSQLEAEVKELAEKRDMYKLLNEKHEGEVKKLRDVGRVSERTCRPGRISKDL